MVVNPKTSEHPANWITSNYLAIGRISKQSTLYRCDNNYWCCSAGGNITSCCSENNNQFRIPAIAQIQNGSDFIDGYTIAPIAALASFTAGARTGATGSAAPSPADSNADTTFCPAAVLASASASGKDSNDNKALAAGLGAGLGIGIPLLAALAGAFFLLSKSKKENAGLKRDMASRGTANGYNNEKAMGVGMGDGQGAGLHEMPESTYRTPELPNSPAGTVGSPEGTLGR